jgi:hypothetical protein
LTERQQALAAAGDSMRRLQQVVAQVADIRLYMQPVKDLTTDAMVSRPQYQLALQDANPAELPLMLGTGTGSELRHPLGVTSVGGRILSQMPTRFTMPVIYLAFDRLSFWLRGRHGSGAAPRGAAW